MIGVDACGPFVVLDRWRGEAGAPGLIRAARVPREARHSRMRGRHPAGAGCRCSSPRASGPTRPRRSDQHSDQGRTWFFGNRRHPVWVMTTGPAVRQCEGLFWSTPIARAVRGARVAHALLSAWMSATHSTPHGLKQDIRPERDIGPERLLVGYLIVVFGLLVRVVGKVFGVSGEGSTLLTLGRAT